MSKNKGLVISAVLNVLLVIVLIVLLIEFIPRNFNNIRGSFVNEKPNQNQKLISLYGKKFVEYDAGEQVRAGEQEYLGHNIFELKASKGENTIVVVKNNKTLFVKTADSTKTVTYQRSSAAPTDFSAK
ncbi:hypothetical protein EQG49_13225 [Periweissella cryptocerci]|uniref:Uncharacterized protein n=1 Tax=Periweissella cryptocerci TaxID=2506420 RepID=A0A4P6YWY0_9LACO|nr:hypothetical protein [Periweissella cryptocerci]QBO37358.1 hypothetical protein EQG49_13225 [Periweissella cryptocerci]